MKCVMKWSILSFLGLRFTRNNVDMNQFSKRATKAFILNEKYFLVIAPLCCVLRCVCVCVTNLFSNKENCHIVACFLFTWQVECFMVPVLKMSKKSSAANL